MNNIFKKLLSTTLAISMLLPYLSNASMALDNVDENPLYKKVNFLEKEDFNNYIKKENLKPNKDGFYEIKYSENMPDSLKSEYKTKNDTGFYTDKEDEKGIFQIPESVDFIMKNTNIKAKHIVLPKSVKYILSDDLEAFRIKYFNKDMEFNNSDKYVYEDPENPFDYKSFTYNDVGNEIQGFTKEGREIFEKTKKLSFPRMNEEGTFITKIGVNAFSDIDIKNVDMKYIKDYDESSFKRELKNHTEKYNIDKPVAERGKSKVVENNPIKKQDNEKQTVTEFKKDESSKDFKLENSKTLKSNEVMKKDEENKDTKKESEKKDDLKTYEVKKEVLEKKDKNDVLSGKPKNFNIVKNNGLDLTKCKLVEPKKLSKDDYNYIINHKKLPSIDKKKKSWLDAIFQPSSADGFILELDGSKIETNTVSWILENGSTRDRLTIEPIQSSTYFFVRARLNMALSGQYNYKTGEIQISIPKKIFKDRNGNYTGNISLAVPELPDKSQPFAYIDNGDKVVIVNTRDIPAATQATFEFTLGDLRAEEIKDMITGYKSEPFNALIEATTKKGNKISKKSNDIDCEIDTSAELRNVEEKGNFVYESYPNSFPDKLKPENSGDYIYASWTSNTTVLANQPYKIDVLNNFTGYNAKFLGYSMQGNVVKTDNGNIKDVFNGCERDVKAKHAYVTYYVAYPKNNFAPNRTYTLENSVDYTLTSLDDKAVSKAKAEASLVYRPIKFEYPGGQFAVHKYSKGTYNYHLNKLKSGKNVDLDYQVESLAFGLPWTYEGNNREDPSNYGKKEYKVITRDYKVELAELSNLDEKTYSFKSLTIEKPDVYDYKKVEKDGEYYVESKGKVGIAQISQGNWAYVPTDKPCPDINIYGKVGEVWKKYGVYKYGGTIISENGANVEDNTLKFPENVVEYKTEFSTKQVAVNFKMYPKVTIKSNPKVRDYIEDLYKNSDTPVLDVYNEVDMNFIGFGKEKFVNYEGAANDMFGFSYGSSLFKELKYKNDQKNRRVMLYYKSYLTTQTNLSSLKDLNEAKEQGLYKDHTSGIWYDLLPKGVVPNTRSIIVRKGDKVKKVTLVEDYKGSGRTLMKVYVDLKKSYKYQSNDLHSLIGSKGLYDSPEINFTASYTWESLGDWGDKLVNNIAFESDNDKLGSIRGLKGEPDDPTAGENFSSKSSVKGVEDVLKDLNPEHDRTSFLYANSKEQIVVDTYAITSLRKDVDVNGENKFTDGLTNEQPKNVYENGEYSYRLRIKNPETSASKDIIFYDKLEGYIPTSDKDDYKDSQWKGQLLGIDTSQLEKMGAKPVIYYSTKKDIKLDDSTDRTHNNINNNSIWTTVKPNAKDITAIAIDVRKTKDGKDFILDSNQSASAIINMKAPQIKDFASEDDIEKWYDKDLNLDEKEEALNGGGHAYNNATTTLVSVSKEGGSQSDNLLIRNDYTKVGLKPYNIKIKKTFEDDNDRDGYRQDSIKMNLLADDQVVDSVILNNSNKWEHNFGKKPYLNENGKKIEYSFKEENPNGYTLNSYPLETKEGVLYRLVNVREIEKVSIKGKKTWDKLSHKPDSINISLWANDEFVSSKTVYPNKEGKWVYNFGDLPKNKDKKPIKYTVKEDYIEGFKPEYNDKNLDIHNKIYPYGDLKVSKKLKNATEKAKENVFKFKLSITNAKGEDDNDSYDFEKSNGQTGKISNGSDFTLKGDENITIKNIKSTHLYEVKEYSKKGFEADNDTLIGKIKSGQIQYSEFINTYDTSGEAKIEVKKKLKGRKLQNYQFIFDIYDANGKIVKSGANNSDGDILFGVLKYGIKDLGKEHEYTIKERIADEKGYTFDKHEEKIKVTLTDNGDGTIKTDVKYLDGKAEFNNIYEAKGKVSLSAKKVIRGGYKPKDDQFKFKLINVTKGIDLDTVTNKGEDIKFKELHFTQDDVGQTYKYEAVEIDENNPDVTYDKSKIKYSITVYDNGDGTLGFDVTAVDTKTDDLKNDQSNPIFANQYKPGSLEIRKLIEGNENAEFTFKIKFTGEETLIPNGKIDSKADNLNGSVKFIFENQEGVLSDLLLTSREDGEHTINFRDQKLVKNGSLWFSNDIEGEFDIATKITYTVLNKKVTKMAIDGKEISEETLKKGFFKFIERPCPIHNVELTDSPFKGEKELIGYKELCEKFGLNKGFVIHENNNFIAPKNKKSINKWLEYEINGKHLFVSKLPINTSVRFDELYNKGLVYSDDEIKKANGNPIRLHDMPEYKSAEPIEINGKKYRVRLISGINDNNKLKWETNNNAISEFNSANKSEYKNLILSIVKPKYYKHFSNIPQYKNPDTNSLYNWEDFCLETTNGVYEGYAFFLQDAANDNTEPNIQYILSLGSYNSANSTFMAYTDRGSAWRPVLEEVKDPIQTNDDGYKFYGLKSSDCFISYKDVLNKIIDQNGINNSLDLVEGSDECSIKKENGDILLRLTKNQIIPMPFTKDDKGWIHASEYQDDYYLSRAPIFKLRIDKDVKDLKVKIGSNVYKVDFIKDNDYSYLRNKDKISQKDYNFTYLKLTKLQLESQPFKGESDLITYKDLVERVGLTNELKYAGKSYITSKDSDFLNPSKKDSVDKWLKYEIDGKKLYVSKLPVGLTISYEKLISKGIIFDKHVIDEGGSIYVDRGNLYKQHKPIEINGKKYRVRLLRAYFRDPNIDITNSSSTSSEMYKTNGSEWNKLILSIIKRGKTPDLWGQYDKDLADEKQIEKWVNPQTKKQYTWDDLCLDNKGNKETICQEAENYEYIPQFNEHIESHATRGNKDGAAKRSFSDKEFDGGNWRPVLEEID